MSRCVCRCPLLDYGAMGRGTKQLLSASGSLLPLDKKCFHSTPPLASLEFLLAVPPGYILNSVFDTMPWWQQWFSHSFFPTMGGLMASYVYKRSKFDEKVNRTRFMSKSVRVNNIGDISVVRGTPEEAEGNKVLEALVKKFETNPKLLIVNSSVDTNAPIAPKIVTEHRLFITSRIDDWYDFLNREKCSWRKN